MILIIFSPISPAHMDWAPYFPGFIELSPTESNDQVEAEQNPESNPQSIAAIEPSATNSGDIRRLTKDVEVADIGCGFGGLLVALAPKLPNTLMLGSSLSLCGTIHGLTFYIRHGNQNAGCRICPRADQSFASSEGGRGSISERGMSSRQQHEISSRFLQEGSIVKDLPLFPGSPFQGSKAQGTDCLYDVEL
jgi:hypothetical protein